MVSFKWFPKQPVLANCSSGEKAEKYSEVFNI